MWKRSETVEVSAIARAWPIRPKAVTSVREWMGRWPVIGGWPKAAGLRSAGRRRAAVPTWFVVEHNVVMTSLAVLFSVVIERVAASLHDCLAMPFLIAVQMTHVPSALVITNQ